MKYKNIIINNNKISYILNNKSSDGCKISVVFLCGYNSDKSGKKAKYLSQLRKEFGFEYLRFDYSGHGKSTGNINNLLLSDWINESKIIIENITKYPLIIIGSSMGGWIAFYLTTIIKRKVLAVIGISTAVDFTSYILKNLSKKNFIKYMKEKKVIINSNYSSSPYIFTKNFIDDSKRFFLLNNKNKIICKSTLLFGLEDDSVPLTSQVQLLEKINNTNVSLIISKKSDHRMSSKYDLNLIKITLYNYIKNS
ncbi:MAG: alpha/beta fold hydrolase [Pseudomonadota bacterium]|nr:alpha/beta fold hydrolase [Pseudomonadota bacterium]